jgi:hypothetical protein|tara:strand:+ start:4189 stop:4704 length:516 start_codon:yes stop_codon:yes gene_type:complete
MNDQLKILAEAQKNLSFESISKSLTEGLDPNISGASNNIAGGFKDFFMQGFGDVMGLGTGESELKKLLGSFMPDEVKNILGFDSTPELKDPTIPDTTTSGTSTNTQNMIATQNQQAAASASRTMNNPSAGNGGVIRDMSTATTPGIGQANHGIDTIYGSIHAPPANRTLYS